MIRSNHKEFKMPQNRFSDENKRLTDFQKEVWVVCPACKKKAVALADYERNVARLFCTDCGYHKEIPTRTSVFGITGNWKMAAHLYFDAELWFQYPFKNNVFWAYSPAHLDYLERYISAFLREHKDRQHFTLVEKLPKFYHEAKNRNALLKIIAKLKEK